MGFINVDNLEVLKQTADVLNGFANVYEKCLEKDMMGAYFTSRSKTLVEALDKSLLAFN